MGMRKNKNLRDVESLDPKLEKLAEGLPPLEFKGHREPPKKGKKRNSADTDAQGRKRR